MSWFYQYQVWKQYGSLWHPDRPSWTNRPSEHRTLVALIPQQQLQSAAFPCTCCWHAHPVPEVTNVTKCTSIFYDILWYLYIISISRQCLIRFMLARGIPLNFSNSLKKKWRAIERNIKLTNCTPFLWKNKNKSINISPKWRLAGCHLCSDLLRCPGRQSSGSRSAWDCLSQRTTWICQWCFSVLESVPSGWKTHTQKWCQYLSMFSQGTVVTDHTTTYMINGQHLDGHHLHECRSSMTQVLSEAHETAMLKAGFGLVWIYLNLVTFLISRCSIRACAQGSYHPLKMMVSSSILFQGFIFRFHVELHWAWHDVAICSQAFPVHLVVANHSTNEAFEVLTLYSTCHGRYKLRIS